MPHFQVILGGKWQQNAGSYGLAIGAVPSKRIPQVVDRITDWYVQKRVPGESFQDFISRVGKKEARGVIALADPASDTAQHRSVIGRTTWDGNLVFVLDVGELIAAATPGAGGVG